MISGKSEENGDGKEETGRQAHGFSQSLLDALSAHIAVLNRQGEIIAVNRTWRRFAASGACAALSGKAGDNYLERCDAAVVLWPEEAPVIARGIREVAAGDKAEFLHEYICHTPSRDNWFEMRVSPFENQDSPYLMVANNDITERKKYERVNRLYNALSHIGRVIVQVTGPGNGEFFEGICRALVEQGGFSIACIGWQGEKEDAIEPVAAAAKKEAPLEALRPLLADMQRRVYNPDSEEFQNRRPFISNDCPDFYRNPLSQAWGTQGGHRVHAYAILPLYFEDRVRGTIAVYSGDAGFFQDKEIALLEEAAANITYALNALQTEEKHRQSEAELRQIKEELEARVIERTRELEEAKKEAEVARKSAENANVSKNEFLSRMSHELRTPLNAILGFSQILDEQELTSHQKESVKYILKGGRHLLNLINDVLDIARIEAGRFDISVEPLSLDDIVEEACVLVRPLAVERKVQLYLDPLIVPNYYVMADKRQFKQVLINLISNAIKYNPPGGEVAVSWQPSPDNSRIHLSVRDTGYGISPENLSKLFVPFERLDAGNSNVEGTGLGLVLSQRLLQSMGGTLSAESTLGEGSTFFFDLPATAPPENALAALPRETPKRSRAVPERQYTLLLIEDNLSNLRLIEMILADRPEVSLSSAMQGSVGLDLARQHNPDIILLDLHLPDMPGQQVLAQLKRSALTRDIPVIIISADASPSRIQRLKTQGVDAYLSKPLDVLDFLRLLDELLPSNNPAEPEPGTEENGGQ